jgi:hypothetical protein
LRSGREAEPWGPASSVRSWSKSRISGHQEIRVLGNEKHREQAREEDSVGRQYAKHHHAGVHRMQTAELFDDQE